MNADAGSSIADAGANLPGSGADTGGPGAGAAPANVGSGQQPSSAPKPSPAGRVVLGGLLWMAVGGFLLQALNALMRKMTLQLDPMQAQFLRYLFGLAAMLPVIVPTVWRTGWTAYRPNGLGGQIWRGVVHTGAMTFFFAALPHLPLADVTAIMFTTPLFVLVGATLFLGERIPSQRWLAAAVGFIGVLVVVWPHLSGRGAGIWSLIMLAAAPLFAGSFLITKALTRRDSPSVIVTWQAITVCLFSVPMAALSWSAPSPPQWGWFALSGVIGTLAHYCFTRAFSLIDISTTQPVRFLDLIYASIFGFWLFGNVPSPSALVGGVVILASTIWIARRDTRATS
ncbi:MAG: DMT family transporter [Burkholderiaceae bacterium]